MICKLQNIWFVKQRRVYISVVRRFRDLLISRITYLESVARWLTGRASDLHIADTGFDSRPGRCRVKTLGKFLTPMYNVVLYNII